jgi:acetyltransferase-like isoleucine patch superfamily enzyme
MSWKTSVKRLCFLACLLAVAPLVALSWLEKQLTRREGVFVIYLRAAYYFGTLDDCAWEVHLGFGSLVTHRHARLARNVSTGAYCIIGHVAMGEGVRLASRVSIPSGKRQHLDESGQLSDGTWFDRVTIGSGSWVGEGAIVMADVGRSCIVSAGGVVTATLPDACIAGGNPARVLKKLEAAAGHSAVTG